jgi:hypothetical protein
MMWGGVDVDAYLALIWIFDAYLWLRSFAWRNMMWLCNDGNMGMGKTYNIHYYTNILYIYHDKYNNMLMSYIDTRLFWEGRPNHQLFLHIRSLNRRVLIHLIHIVVPQAMWCTASWRIATTRRPSGVEDAAIWMDDDRWYVNCIDFDL